VRPVRREADAPNGETVRRLDRYIFGQIVGPLLFFTVVFAGVIWLTQSLRIIDTVLNNGQSARVFLEFVVLLLPMVMSIVLPLALLAAVLHVVNRLFTDSEIVVMLAAGVSGTALLRAVAILAALVVAVVHLLTLVLRPTAQRELRDRINAIRGDVAAAFVREGAFLAPTTGLTVYLRERGGSGEFFGVFVQDERDPDRTVTYTAERALLLREDGATLLVMFDGIAQSQDARSGGNLSLLRFKRLAYDLTRFDEGARVRTRKPSEMYVHELLSISDEDVASRPVGEYRAEAHEAISSPLYGLAFPLLAVAFVVGGGFRRRGFAGRVVLTVLVAVVLRLSGFAAKAVVTGTESLWPLMYAPPVLGVAAAFWMLADWRSWRRSGAPSGSI